MKKLLIDNFQHPAVSYGFFSRQGGVSQGLYDSLNCAPHSQDNPEHIAENRCRVLAELGGEHLSTLKQIHSPLCRMVEQSTTTPMDEGDALVTRTASHVLGVLTADCGPVLFYGEDSAGHPVIGAAHAGWGGALKGVLESTIEKMQELGAVKETIHAALGPCIGPVSYEVDISFQVPFVDEDNNAARFFAAGKDNAKLMFDMPSYIAYRLRRAGVLHVAIAGHNTYAMEQDYFSYRRATHRGEKDYGRQISAIMIRNG